MTTPRIEEMVVKRDGQDTWEVRYDEAVEENKKLRLHLSVILPMAKGYVHKNDVGRNREMVSNAEDYLAEIEALDDTIKELQDNK